MSVALFVDDHHVRAADGVRRVFHQFEKHPDNPIHVFRNPWDENLIIRGAHGGYERDPETGDFILWYQAGPKDPGSDSESRLVCQARSRDGLRWETPPLGVYPFREHRETNICVVGYTQSGAFAGEHEMDALCIGRDPLDPDPQARFKMSIWRYNRGRDLETGRRLNGPKDTPFPSGLYTSVSPDGIHWPTRERLVLYHDDYGDTNSWMLDTLRRGYRLFCKRIYYDERRQLRIRLRHTSWSPDFASWSPTVPILPIDEHDRPEDQVYQNAGFVYGDLYLSFVRVLHALDDWSQDIDLAHSRDGEEWARPPEARRILPRGEGDAWDSGMLAVFPSPPVRVGDRLFLYYTSTEDVHRPAPVRRIPPDRTRPPGLSLATLRVDGFAGLRAGGEGRVRTRPLLVEHDHLTVNVDAARGACRVGLLDEAGLPVPGFTPEDAEPIHQDTTAGRPRWGAQASIAHLAGCWISLDIRLKGAELFAVRNETRKDER